MALSGSEIQILAEKQALKSVVDYLYNREVVQTKHPLISVIFPDQYAMRSVIGGLETSLGTSLWENLALELAHANSIVMHHPSTFKKVTNLPEKLITLKNSLDLDPKSYSIVDEFMKEVELILASNNSYKFKTAKIDKGHGADLYFEIDKNVYVVDIKTVQWNAAGGADFLERLLKWAMYASIHHPGSQKHVKIVIPYNPFIDPWWVMSQRKAEPLYSSDILVGNEFWNLLTGNSDSYSHIEKGLQAIVSHPVIKLFKSHLTDPVDETFKKEIFLLYKNLKVINWNRLANGNSGKLDVECQICKKIFSGSETSLLNQDECPDHDKKHKTKKDHESEIFARRYGLSSFNL